MPLPLLSRAGTAGQADLAPPDAIILSGPDTYIPQITQLYGGYKRTGELHGRAAYQKDPDQGDSGFWDAYIYWSAADSKWCIARSLGLAIGELHGRDSNAADPVPIYQAAPSESERPCLDGSWVVNLYGTGTRYQADHALRFESLVLPPEAADRRGRRKFIDYEFPPKATSIEGEVPPLRSAAPQEFTSEHVTWVAATDLSGHHTGPLFEEQSRPPGDWLAEIPPEQGGLCPILAAVHEYPGHVEGLFSPSAEVSQRGGYAIRLYDAYRSEWQRVAVDEFVPVTHLPNGTPRPWGGGHTGTLWALLLAKALAKLCGSYEALLRSEPGLLLLALTGQRGLLARWQRDGSWWSQWGFAVPEQQLSGASPSWSYLDSPPRPKTVPTIHQRVRAIRPLKCDLGRIAGSWQQNSEFFNTLRELHRGNALLFARRRAGADLAGDAASKSASDPSGSGLLHGHGYLGYSILALLETSAEAELGCLRLVQLRNLWGPEQQWRGPWSDGASEWRDFPEVRRHVLRPEHRATGRFWMSWPDFCEAFHSVEMCPMPSAARKASQVPRPLQRPRAPASSEGAWWSPHAWGLFRERCCTLERARSRQSLMAVPSCGRQRL